MSALASRSWLPPAATERVDQILTGLSGLPPSSLTERVEELTAGNRVIHDVECINLNPATNVMNPRAEAPLASGLGSRPSLGYPGEKYEMGLEAIEEIEVLAAELACRVFRARHAEVRVGSGALANLYAFMAICEPGDTIIAPPATIGGHITHHGPGAAGLYRLRTLDAPVLADGYTVDVAALRGLARRERPRLITVGGSLNLTPHPVSALREIADEVGAWLLFDAAHLCGMVAGGTWPDPLAQGAHLMAMSTYKSLGGPPGGLVVTDDPELAQRLEAIAYPGLTANADAGRIAALAVTLADWAAAGPAYAAAMVSSAARLAEELASRDVPVFAPAALSAEATAALDGPRAEASPFTASHQLAVVASGYGGGQRAARRLRQAHVLACGIGLPLDPVEGDVNGLRLGTPEVVRRGMVAGDMPTLADFVARGLDPDTDEQALAALADEVSAWRQQFTAVRFTTDDPGVAAG